MRDGVRRLAGDIFDVLIVGAGIHGAAAAWTAARLGLRTALIDQGDFGGGASANSLKIIHGGLRYLQQADLPRIRESVRARRLFLQLAPHLVRPQAFLVPTHGAGLRGRAAMAAALCVNDLVSAGRNKGVAPSRRLPAGRLLRAAAARELLDGVARPRITGAAVWHDAFAENTERLTLSFVMSAQQAGATAANYVRARRLRIAGTTIDGVEVEDALQNETFLIRAGVVVNAAGPWWEQPWTGAAQARHALVSAWNVVVRRQWFGAYGVGLERSGRNLFFVPWRGGTMIGTVYEPFAGDPSEARPSERSVEAFLGEINAAYPPAKLARGDVTFIQAGVQPGPPPGANGAVEPDRHSEIVEEAARGGPPRVLSIKGVKYTTGVTVGMQAARRAAGLLGYVDVLKESAPLYGGERVIDAGDVAASARSRRLEIGDAVCRRLAVQYGTRAEAVLDMARDDGGALLPGLDDTLSAEVRHAIRAEHAVRLSDVVLRRTDVGTFAPPSDETRTAIEEIMTRELGWSPLRVTEERRQLARDYQRTAP